MTGEIKVSGARIDQLVGEMVRIHGEMGQALDELKASLDLLSSRWNGEAQRAYALAQEEWNRSMQELHDELDRARRNTQASNEVFANTARATKRLWSE
ncbi:WXG100 family type VII secretion target [Agromyces sp. CFH 90414]|uniref:ESAT-6-like protein n=1 Tax=Agromyces agglutinans TaxID=2662258 RepID=A0A6I2FFP0_9MICO|nr:WXG100 family type VII secretion target [Agromyces agglutinans]MRG59798.1 WXG100 family type VII secretion target [Agromyces agglutinans]